jgi:hypothetical protein
MMLPRELSVRGLDVLLVRIPRNPQNPIIVLELDRHRENLLLTVAAKLSLRH